MSKHKRNAPSGVVNGINVKSYVERYMAYVLLNPKGFRSFPKYRNRGSKRPKRYLTDQMLSHLEDLNEWNATKKV